MGPDFPLRRFAQNNFPLELKHFKARSEAGFRQLRSNKFITGVFVGATCDEVLPNVGER